jgi:hypothetical protein
VIVGVAVGGGVAVGNGVCVGTGVAVEVAVAVAVAVGEGVGEGVLVTVGVTVTVGGSWALARALANRITPSASRAPAASLTSGTKLRRWRRIEYAFITRHSSCPASTREIGVSPNTYPESI